MTLLDKSNYLKGLLILIGKDRSISEEEKKAIRRLGKILGFDAKFCEDAMNELLENEYIVEEPPKFSTKEVALSFIKDGINLACSDGSYHLPELNWLISIADKNGIDKMWCIDEFDKTKSTADKNSLTDNFEVTALIQADQ